VKIFAALVLGLWLLGASAWAGDGSQQDLIVKNAATLETPAGLGSAAIYVVIENGAMTGDELTGVEVAPEIAQSAELDNTKVEADGSLTPYPVGSILLSPVSYNVLGPGGSHIKLLDLQKPLLVGDEVPLMLDFATAGRRAVTARVLTARDFVELYPLETTTLTIKKLRADYLKKKGE
jgi:copper(I)-binding protein